MFTGQLAHEVDEKLSFDFNEAGTNVLLRPVAMLGNSGADFVVATVTAK